MADTKKKLLIIADDHPRVREALEYLVAELHGSLTLYTADDPRQLLPLADKRIAEATELALIDIRATGADASTDAQDRSPQHDAAGATTPEPDGTGAPLIVVSAQELGITAHWFAAIGAGEDEGSDETRIQAALDQRSIVMDLVRSLRQAATPLGAPEQEASPALPNTDSLMQLGLTQRQAEVLANLAEGLTNKEIARKLDVSEWTVRHHVSAILERLEVSNRGRAALFARRLGET